jgi:hypothetical protein
MYCEIMHSPERKAGSVRLDKVTEIGKPDTQLDTLVYRGCENPYSHRMIASAESAILAAA